MGHAVGFPLLDKNRPWADQRNHIRIVEEEKMPGEECITLRRLDEWSVIGRRRYHFGKVIVKMSRDRASGDPLVQRAEIHHRAAAPRNPVSANLLWINIPPLCQVIDGALDFELLKRLQFLADQERFAVEP